MNARLKKVKDGTGAMHRNEVVWFQVRSGSSTTRSESGEIYWPFALVWDCTSASDHCYTVVHLPSGYWLVTTGLPRRRALALVRRLRPLADWSFTAPTGKKWDAVKRAAETIVLRARGVATSGDGCRGLTKPSKSKASNAARDPVSTVSART